MTDAKLYTTIYIVLFAMATVQVLVEFAGFTYWTAFAAIIALSFTKALLVAGYYQHLRSEPRSISLIVLVGLLAALALTLAASYSIM
ncbi:cytochrome C oxidase subunit IV family protein [Haladaptatus pallidirubidus]|uniref:Cytochrome c oxidase subunit 4 n=1 Tax=Haladaptatus pallidirubidus TaxID=1008152 RepID=A0AAV3UKA4_9EURY|nr:cytochrome C oxidase subunit IV family protein [Haladaptatus pallidirubidus]